MRRLTRALFFAPCPRPALLLPLLCAARCGRWSWSIRMGLNSPTPSQRCHPMRSSNPQRTRRSPLKRSTMARRVQRTCRIRLAVALDWTASQLEYAALDSSFAPNPPSSVCVGFRAFRHGSVLQRPASASRPPHHHHTPPTPTPTPSMRHPLPSRQPPHRPWRRPHSRRSGRPRVPRAGQWRLTYA